MSDSEKLGRVVEDLVRENNVDLKDLIKPVVLAIAGEFTKAKLIPRGMEEQMLVMGVDNFTLATKLLNACQTSLTMYPDKNFPKFIEILKRQGGNMELRAEEMESKFEQARVKMSDGGGHAKSAVAKRVAASPSPTGAFVPDDQSPSPSAKRPRPDPNLESPSAHQDQSSDWPDLGSPLEEPQEVREHEEVYHVTTRKSHALAVILNNYTFTDEDCDDLPASENDVSWLQKVLEDTLGFEVVKRENLTGEDIEHLFKSHIDHKIEERHDSFFCCILSHGDKGMIYGTDGKPVSIADLMKSLNAKGCKDLSGKPKIMIIDCCRGPLTSKPVRVKHPGSETSVSDSLDSKSPGPPKFISPHSDFIFGYSTFQDESALIGEDGSLYIHKLCEVMEKNVYDCSLNQMLCRVNRKLQEHGPQLVEKNGRRHKFVQIGQVEHTLQDFVFFQKP